MFFDTDFLRDDEIKLVLEMTESADKKRQWVPAYIFAICNHEGEKMGVCSLRIGHNMRTYYGGNIGYEVYEPFRGHHYAAKACRLLFELAKKHDLGYVLITCRPDNAASRKTCEHLGCRFLEDAEVTPECGLPLDGRTHQRIFRLDL